MPLLLAAAVLVFAYALVSRRLESSMVTAPMIFTAIGIAIGALGLFELESLDTGTVGILAEATLVLILFTDAIRIDLRRLREDAALPTRLLVIGLPISVALGTLVGYLVLGDLGLISAFVLATILTPTDAALGKAVVTDERVPVRIRQTINVESGLNDGIMLPIVTVAVALLVGEPDRTDSTIGALLISELGLGILMGAVAGWVGGRLLDVAAARGNVDGIMRQLGTLAIGVSAFAGAELAGGNGFVAAFVAGLVFGAVARDHCEGAYDFAADEGELLTLLTFLAFGVAVVGPQLSSPTLGTVIYALLSLTLVRMIPVALSLIGTGLKMPTIGFIGWFGPRGLASILFGVFLLEEVGSGVSEPIFSVVVWVVLFSIFLHGLSAAVLSRSYGRWYSEQAEESMMEAGEVFEHPVRG